MASFNDEPSSDWWAHASQSFMQLQNLLNPHPCSLEAEERYMQQVRSGVLPWAVVLRSGTFQLNITAKEEPLEVVVLGTGAFGRWSEVLWEEVNAKNSMRDPNVREGSEGLSVNGEEVMEVRIHEVNHHPESKVSLSVGDFEFAVRYLEAGDLVMRLPTASEILNTPRSLLDDPENHIDEAVTQVVYDLQRNEIYLDDDHRSAYYYIRAWGIAKGLFDTKGASKGFLYQDFVRSCKPSSAGCTTGVDNIIRNFFQHMHIELDIPASPTEEDWTRMLMEAQNESFYAKMPDFPYFIQISLVYSGSSKLKGGEWLSLVDRKVVALKNRLEARVKNATVQIWPQRLVSSKSNVDDDPYEGYLMIGLKCSEADIPFAEEISERWRAQLDQDTPSQGEHFVYITIADRNLTTESSDLKRDTRVWPRSVLVKDDDNRTKAVDDLVTDKKRRSPHKFPENPVEVIRNDQKNDSKGAKLRPASEILSRLRHDRQYNIDECVVGYKDRHLSKMQEKSAAEWKFETTHEEFIPQHRIEYVRKGSEIIWDRQAKTYKVFKSGV